MKELKKSNRFGKNGGLRKVFSTITAAALVVGSIAVGTSGVFAAEDNLEEETPLGVSGMPSEELALGLSNISLFSIGGTGEAEEGSTVYFGMYPQEEWDWVPPRNNASWPSIGRLFVIKDDEKDGSTILDSAKTYPVLPLQWELLENGTDSLTLITKDNIEIKGYNGGADADWSTSSIRTFLNSEFLNMKAVESVSSMPSSPIATEPLFSTAEKNAVDGEVTILSQSEVMKYYPVADDRKAKNNGYTSSYQPSSDPGALDYWWLRNAGTWNSSAKGYAAYVDQNTGNIVYEGARTNRKLPVRPVVTIDKDRVVLIADSTGGRPTTTNTFTAAGTVSNSLKLVLVDSSLPSVGVSTSPITINKNNPATHTVSLITSSNHSGLVSAVLEQEGDVKYYAQLGSGFVMGDTLTLDLSGVDAGQYKLKIFSEEIRPGFESDLASVPTVIDLKVDSDAPAISTNSLPKGHAGESYSYSVVSVGNPAPTFSATGLPAGLDINAATGVISGISSAAGSYSVTITATNGHGTATVSALPLNIYQKPFINTSSLPGGTQNVAYNQTIQFGGNPTANLWVSQGRLPAGLSLDSNTGAITGTPQVGGVYNFTVTAENAEGSVSENLSINITPTSDPAIVNSNAQPFTYVAGTPFSITFNATGVPIPTLSHSSGSLPAGVTFQAGAPGSGTGVLSGTAATAGTYRFQIKASNGTTHSTKYFDLEILPAGSMVPPTISPATLPDGTVGTAYSQTVTASGVPVPDLSMTAADMAALSAIGLTFQPGSPGSGTAVISGTPTAAATINVQVNAGNSAGNASQVYNIVIAPAGGSSSAPFFLTPPVLVEGVVGQWYDSGTIQAGGNPAPSIRLKAGETLPAGLSWDASTNSIKGTPTTAGTYSFRLVATNIVCSVDAFYTITVKAGGVTPPNPTAAPSVSYFPTPMNLKIGGQGNIAVTLGDASGTLAAKAVVTSGTPAVSLSDGTLTSDSNVVVYAVSSGNGSITVEFYDAAGNVMPAYTQTIPVSVTGGNGGTTDGGSRPGGSGGGGGGGNSSNLDSKPGTGSPGSSQGIFNGNNTPEKEKSVWDNFMKKIPAAVKGAASKNKEYANLNIQNANVLTVEQAKKIVAEAKANGGKITFSADSIVAKAVAVRLTLNPELVTEDIKLYASVSDEHVKSLLAIFNKFYTNQFQVVYFAHQANIGQKAHIAAKVDLTGFDMENIVFYSYDRQNNKVNKMQTPNYWVDKAGYLHFDTEILGNIIISNGDLVKR